MKSISDTVVVLRELRRMTLPWLDIDGCTKYPKGLVHELGLEQKALSSTDHHLLETR